MDPRPRTDVHQVVGGANRVFVVLHHDQGVAQVAQLDQGGEQAVVVALVQADARLIQHVEHAGEACADLGGQADALGFAAAEGHRRAVEAEVIEPHIQQELQAHADLPEHQIADLDLAGREQGFGIGAGAHAHQGLNAGQGFGHAHGRELMDRVRTDPHGQRLGLEPQTPAGGAGHQLQVLLQFLANRFAAGIAQLALQDRQDPLKRPHIGLALAVAAVRLDGDRLPAAVEQHIALLIAELIPGGLQFEAEGLAHRIEKGEVVAVVLVAPGGDSGIHGLGGIGHHPLGGELTQMADAVAIGAGAIGAVEGEEARRELLHHSAMDGAGKILGIEALPLHPLGQLFAALGHHLHQGQTFTPLEGGAQRIGETLLHSLTGHEAVDHHLDVVGVVLIELDVVGQLTHLAIDANPGKALGHQTAEQLHVGALLAPHHRRQQLIAGALR